MSTDKSLNLAVFIIDGKTYVIKSSHSFYLNSTFIVGKDGTRFPAKNVEEDQSVRAISQSFFDKEFNPNEDSFIRVVKKKQDTQIYKLNVDRPHVKKTIDENTWNLLPGSLKSLYTREKEIKEEITELTVSIVDLAGRKQDSVVFYTPQEVLDNVSRFNFNNNKRARAFGTKVYLHNSNGSVHSEEVIKVVFFVKDYNGEMTKILDKKRGGGFYADRRGKLVKDYPEVSFSYYIKLKDVPQLKASSEEELEKEMQRYVDHITLTSQLLVAQEKN